MPYPPRLSLDDTQVLTKTIKTRVKTDLFKNEDKAVEEIEKEDVALAEKVRRQKRKVSRQKSIRKINKKQKKRSHWLIIQIIPLIHFMHKHWDKCIKITRTFLALYSLSFSFFVSFISKSLKPVAFYQLSLKLGAKRSIIDLIVKT